MAHWQSSREGKYSPKLLLYLANIGVFIDESKKFDKYLRKMDTNQTAVFQGLRLRSANRVCPKVNHASSS